MLGQPTIDYVDRRLGLPSLLALDPQSVSADSGSSVCGSLQDRTVLLFKRAEWDYSVLPLPREQREGEKVSHASYGVPANDH